MAFPNQLYPSARLAFSQQTWSLSWSAHQPDLGLRCPFPVHPLTPATVTHGDPSHWSAPVPTVPSYLPHGKGKSSSPSLPGLLTCPASSLQNTGAKAVLESFVLIPKG